VAYLRDVFTRLPSLADFVGFDYLTEHFFD
jgi:hypothetical protein